MNCKWNDNRNELASIDFDYRAKFIVNQKRWTKAHTKKYEMLLACEIDDGIVSEMGFFISLEFRSPK